LPEGAVVTYEIPLLAENPERAVEFDLILSIETSEEIRRVRLLERGLSNEQASARIAAQAPDSHRRALAHHVIENNGDRDALLRSLEEWWAIFVAPKINR
jgi:dephospho-CoA kinase